MKIFVSYSTPDLALVYKITEHVRLHGEVFFWDKDKNPGAESWPTIFSWIDQADLVLALITEKTLSRAMSVGQEIGRAKAKEKIIIPLVGPDVRASELGFLSGITYQQIRPDNPSPTLKNIERVILARKEKLEQGKALFIVGGVIALFALILSSDK